MALDANPASATFNAYATVAQGDAYHATRLHNTAWTGATDTQKSAAIIWATRNFEIIEWKGWMTNPAQNLQWPRNGVFRDGTEGDITSSVLYSTYMFDPNTIPTFLVEATAEAAFWLLQSDQVAPTGNEGYKRIKADVLELEIDKQDRPKWINDAVKNMIWRYMKNSNPYMAQVVRV